MPHLSKTDSGLRCKFEEASRAEAACLSRHCIDKWTAMVHNTFERDYEAARNRPDAVPYR